jgi:hypothetical protein
VIVIDFFPPLRFRVLISIRDIAGNIIVVLSGEAIIVKLTGQEDKMNGGEEEKEPD